MGLDVICSLPSEPGKNLAFPYSCIALLYFVYHSCPYLHVCSHVKNLYLLQERTLPDQSANLPSNKTKPRDFRVSSSSREPGNEYGCFALFSSLSHLQLVVTSLLHLGMSRNAPPKPQTFFYRRTALLRLVVPQRLRQCYDATYHQYEGRCTDIKLWGKYSF